ncbi:MAG: hypothetical protein KAT71_06730 [Gammaproteobacteria bacterium]|nr:hypothetical protein [Gammaproteobacteria bacterium]
MRTHKIIIGFVSILLLCGVAGCKSNTQAATNSQPTAKATTSEKAMPADQQNKLCAEAKPQLYMTIDEDDSTS